MALAQAAPLLLDPAYHQEKGFFIALLPAALSGDFRSAVEHEPMAA